MTVTFLLQTFTTDQVKKILLTVLKMMMMMMVKLSIVKFVTFAAFQASAVFECHCCHLIKAKSKQRNAASFGGTASDLLVVNTP